MRNRISQITCFLFLFIIFGFMLGTVFSKDEVFSQDENRYLAEKPKFSMSNIISKEFMNDTSDYLNDQLFLRECLVKIKTKLERLSGKKEINGVYLGKDGYLIEKWTEHDIDMDIVAGNIYVIDNLSKKYSIPSNTLIVPTAEYVYQDKIPSNAPVVDQQKMLSEIQRKLKYSNFIDVSNILIERKEKDIFYHTDHHWTTYGAFLGYNEWLKAHNRYASIDDYDIKTVTEDFYGTLYSKVLDKNIKKDQINLYYDLSIPKYRVLYNYGKYESDSIYEMDKLKDKDKYQVFLGGNYPEVTIETENKNGKHLMVFKDSFANAFIPFLIRDYETIHIIDSRYFKDDIDEYILNEDITEFLFLYNLKKLFNRRFHLEYNLEKVLPKFDKIFGLCYSLAIFERDAYYEKYYEFTTSPYVSALLTWIKKSKTGSAICSAYPYNDKHKSIRDKHSYSFLI